ncbi:G1/S-specific cyclin-E [Pieris brassicae]|uniref:G1/S-specific cyclin-E n=1 Tax=Pieris brassicae TaxID=7116 RepID=UPI001E661C94|nr:G1/S-specific cyclin-E [Pieris brassicae]XP_045523891.1 G1/S-specific cyclin-E [Pieris brassicae]XP_045523892.1 G1/S-specific cyclin-E [Pieris brassicae]XP_045523893.1 G1/S-specific cyclin-E [Pieris brassicae]
MAQAGSSCDTEDKRLNLKRKRNSTDDEVENMPPMKLSYKEVEELFDQPAHNVVVESSSCSSDEDGSADQSNHVYTDIDYNADSFLSPPSISDLPNCVLSPLENVARGDSTPHSNKRSSSNKILCPSPPKRKCPLPGLSWADPADVWKNMCECDARSAMKKNPNMFDNHPNLQPRMRAILLDWLNEVCAVYKLHRETFHLTVDYIDRYLSNTADVQKGCLQLIGITCLFIAAKIEEVYPPKITEFAYVTDGSCTTDEILLEEQLVLKILSWSLTPITINSWLNIYLQLASEGRSAKRRLIGEKEVGVNALRGYTFVFPQYSSLEFVICGQLVDLAVLHVDVNKFANSAIAAAAIAHAFSRDLALRVSGYSWEALESCHRWMAAFAAGVRAEGAECVVRGGDGEHVQRAAELSLICPDLNMDESHRIQAHNVTLDMFDKVFQQLQEHTSTQDTCSSSQDHLYPPTPPQSDHKSPKTPAAKTPSTRHISPLPEMRLTEV